MSIPLFAETYDDDLHSRLRNPAASFALTLWQLKRTGDAPPQESDFLAAGVDRFAEDLMVLRPLGDDDWRYERYGARIAHDAGFDMTGRRVSDFHGVLSDFFRGIYQRAVRERRPIATLHRYGHFRERPIWERLVMPVAAGANVCGLYVVNRVREIDQDLSYIKTRGRDHGLIVLQFRRNAAGHVADALIVSANKAARALVGRRLDEIVDQPVGDVLPQLLTPELWRRCREVAETRTPQQSFVTQDGVTQDGEGMVGEFDLLISPFVDGVTLDFAPLQPISLAG
jgi:PAS domain-containing protein